MRRRGRHWRKRTGAGLLELMAAISLSLLITLSSLRVIASAHRDYLRTEQVVLMDEQAAYIIEFMGRLLQQAGHIDATRPWQGGLARPFDGALRGRDNARLGAGSGTIDDALPVTGQTSDVLAVFLSADARGHWRNCGGELVVGADEFAPGWSLFDIDVGPGGEPELRCSYRSRMHASAQALATSVAALQLLYGLDTDHDGLPNDFVSATRVDAADASQTAAQPSAWTRIVAVHLAFLLRSAQRMPEPMPAKEITLFGPAYADRHALADPGVRFGNDQLDAGYLWRPYEAVIFLSNSLEPPA